MTRTIKILVTGGGTSGHISPALAVIGTIKELAAQAGADWQPVFRFVGSQHGMERAIIEQAGISFTGVATGKLRRYLSLENVTDTLRVPLGVVQALGHVARFRPDVVLSTGGYVCVPTVIAASMLRVPIITHEQTVQLGLANRIAGRFATHIALSFPSTVPELPANLRPKAIVTGNPIRPIIFGGDREEGARLVGFAPEDAHLPTVYVTGGSLGARVINRAVEAALPALLEMCRVVHQCGRQPEGEEQDYDRLVAVAHRLPEALRRRHYVTRFVGNEIGHIFALADLLVSRAGANTVAEICALGKPAVYVPLVPTGGDEQTRNARACVTVGAATIITQAELTGDRLVVELRPLLANPTRREAMGEAAQTLARPDAANVLAEAVLKLAKI